MAQKRALIISTAFPPSIGSGVWRIRGFVKYLPRFGWEPYVLTRVPSPYHAPGAITGPTEIPGAVQVTRMPFADIRLLGKKLLLQVSGKGGVGSPTEVVQAQLPGRGARKLLWSLAHTFLFVPDTDIGWLPHAVRPGLSMIRKCGIHVIFSSAPPLTPHLVALRLKKLGRRPWVADFSDPWTQHPDRWFSRLQIVRKPVDRLLETRILNQADITIADSLPRSEGFTRLNVRGIEPKLRVITNGFDPDEYANVQRRPPTKLIITYTGTFVSKAWRPEALFRGIAELISQGGIRRDRIVLRIIEQYPQQTSKLASEHSLSDIVQIQTSLPHQDAIREQVSASVLLFMMRNDPGGFGIYTGKLFEYLGARRPILMLGPKKGVAAELIREANAGTVVDSSNPQEIKEAILKYYREFERTGDVSYSGKEEVIRRYEYPALAEKLAGILDSLVPR